MVLDFQRWAGKVAVVTGASAGIGAAIVDKLVENGLQVVGVARRVERIQEKAKRLAGKKGKLFGVKADMTNQDDIIKIFEWTTKNVGPVSILINNAGVARQTTLMGGDPKQWKEILDTNVLGLSIATSEAIKVMQKHNIDGQIIHINSYLGHVVSNFPGLNMYPASKHAVTALTETLRQELNTAKSKIRISSISPGAVRTEMASSDNLSEEMKEAMKYMPFLEAEDIAEAVYYILATPQRVQIHNIMIKPNGEIL